MGTGSRAKPHRSHAKLCRSVFALDKGTMDHLICHLTSSSQCSAQWRTVAQMQSSGAQAVYSASEAAPWRGQVQQRWRQSRLACAFAMQAPGWAPAPCHWKALSGMSDAYRAPSRSMSLSGRCVFLGPSFLCGCTVFHVLVVMFLAFCGLVLDAHFLMLVEFAVIHILLLVEDSKPVA